MRYFIVIVALIFSSCATSTSPKIVKKSLYLNKSLMKFEMDNGFCYAREALKNGGYKNYWSSDRGNILANALSWDNYPPCKLELFTNKKNIITKIVVVEDSIECVGVLK